MSQIVPYSATLPGRGLTPLVWCGSRVFPKGPLDGQLNPVLDVVPNLQTQRFSEFLIRYPRVAPISAFVLAMTATLFTAMSADGQPVVRHISIGGYDWIFKSSFAAKNVFSQTGMLVLLAGLIISSLLLFIVRLAIQQALYDRQQLRVRQEQDAIRTILTRELNHRVKNTLANVLSILSLSRRNATDLDSFVDTFDGRVRALSATHNLLLQSSWGPASLIQVIQTEMTPYFENDPPRIMLDGPDALIAPNDALSLGLLIHELVTNAAKFGALSNADGTIALTWAFTKDSQILFCWREQGGPPPPIDRRRGFGSDLIEKVVSRELHSDIKLDFAPTGLRVSFAVPLREIAAFALRQDQPV